MSDVLLVDSANAAREQLLRGADVRALDAAAGLVGLPSPLERVKEGRGPVSTWAGLGGARVFRGCLGRRGAASWDSWCKGSLLPGAGADPVVMRGLSACVPCTKRSAPPFLLVAAPCLWVVLCRASI